MRLLHVTHQYAPAIGGAERYIVDLSEELVRRGHTVDVFTSRAMDYHTWANVLPQTATLNGVNVRRFDAIPRRGHTWRLLDRGLRRYWQTRSPWDAAAIWYGNGPVCPGLFWAILRHGRDYDLMHISQLHYAHAATAYAAARWIGLPVVVTPHIHAEQRETHDVGYLWRILHGSCIVLADTPGERDYLVHRGLSPLQVVTGGAGLDLTRFPPQDRAAARGRFGLPADAFVVLFLGRKAEYKGLDATLAAFRRLAATHPHAVLLTVGPETDASRRLWESAGRIPGVVVRGAVGDDERLAALAAADVLALPSTGEAFGIVYLEAWAYGVPVIGAPITAVAALIDDDVDGWLIPPDQVDRLAGRLAWLADHPDAARATGAAGHAKLLRRYTTAHIADIVEAAYVRALRRAHTRGEAEVSRKGTKAQSRDKEV
jgi:glycosyltransferase involved in cell wall biosynthesis